MTDNGERHDAAHHRATREDMLRARRFDGLMLARLGDDALMVALRDTLAEARGRPGLTAHLRHYLADELSEMIAEMLAPSTLDPDAIVRVSHVAADAPAHAEVVA